MVSTRPLISKSSSSNTNPFVIVPSVPIGITVSFMFHSFFSSLARSWYLSLFSLSFSFTLGINCNGKVRNPASSFLFFLIPRGRGFWSKLNDPFVFQHSRDVFSNICLSFSVHFFLLCSSLEQLNWQDNRFPLPCLLTLCPVHWPWQVDPPTSQNLLS